MRHKRKRLAFINATQFGTIFLLLDFLCLFGYGFNFLITPNLRFSNVFSGLLKCSATGLFLLCLVSFLCYSFFALMNYMDLLPRYKLIFDKDHRKLHK